METLQNKIQISVIVATFNPDLKKLEMTINSILKQKDIEYEIIICDDGSLNNYSLDLQKIFIKYSFLNYKFITSNTNNGTVINCYQGIKGSSGEYVYLISPGDYLYEKTTLVNMYRFAMRKNADIVFGDALFYSNNNGIINTDIKGLNAPFFIKPFLSNNGVIYYQDYFNCGNYILGATILRKKEIALNYIGEFIGISKYVEDYSSNGSAILEGKTVYYYNDYVVWYESNTGISNQKSEKWQKLINADYEAIDLYFQKKYKNNHEISTYFYAKQLDNKKRIDYLIKNNPKTIIRYIRSTFIKRFLGRKKNLKKYNLKQYNDNVNL